MYHRDMATNHYERNTMREMKCETCNETFVPETTDDFHADDAGDYHAECYQNWVDEQAQYYGRLLGFLR